MLKIRRTAELGDEPGGTPMNATRERLENKAMLAVETRSSRTNRQSRARSADRLRRPTRRRRGPEPEASALDNPAIVTVFMEPSGTICHSRCRQPLDYQGTRGRLEVDFFCLRCVEHVSLPLHVLSRIPKVSRELTLDFSTAADSSASSGDSLASRGAA